MNSSIDDSPILCVYCPQKISSKMVVHNDWEGGFIKTSLIILFSNYCNHHNLSQLGKIEI